MYGEITPIADAGHVNAYLTLNIRGRRSRTDPADKDPNMSDALEVARAEDAYFARAGQFVGPLHGIPFAIKDNYDTADMRAPRQALPPTMPTTSRRETPPRWQNFAPPARPYSARPISMNMRRPAFCTNHTKIDFVNGPNKYGAQIGLPADDTHGTCRPIRR
jgi:hypothetical protein